MPELPELVYDSLRQGKYLQIVLIRLPASFSQIMYVRDNRLFSRNWRYVSIKWHILVGQRPEWGLMPGWLMAGGLIAWFSVGAKHADFFIAQGGPCNVYAALFNHHLPQRNMYGWYQYWQLLIIAVIVVLLFGTKKLGPSVPILVRRSKALKKQ